MLPSVYIETSIVSYLVARPSRDSLMATRQLQTRDWWANLRSGYKLFTSELVAVEVMRGEQEMARRRAQALFGIPLLVAHPEVDELTKALIGRGPLPQRAESDAYHISLATVNGLDILLTWNCRHIANPRMYATIAKVCRGRGFEPPILCTPDDLMRR
ncbi:MAG TPA: type II toxin-antitoxin system VapC family toxin [Longimicrobium sp.]|jgi:hypothetical protein